MLFDMKFWKQVIVTIVATAILSVFGFLKGIFSKLVFWQQLIFIVIIALFITILGLVIITSIKKRKQESSPSTEKAYPHEADESDELAKQRRIEATEARINEFEQADQIKEIKQTGYWRVLISPTILSEKKIDSLQQCKNIIRQTSVNLRLRDFPSLTEGQTINGTDWFQSGYNDNTIKECYRYFQDSQLLYYCVFREDYRKQEIIESNVSPIIDYTDKSKLPSKFMSIDNLIFGVTKVFEFSANLISNPISKDLLTPSFVMSISLNDMEGRMLFVWNGDLRQSYICALKNFEYPHKGYDSEDFLENRRRYAQDCAVWIFKRFNWNLVPRSLIESKQADLLAGRI